MQELPEIDIASHLPIPSLSTTVHVVIGPQARDDCNRPQSRALDGVSRTVDEAIALCRANHVRATLCVEGVPLLIVRSGGEVDERLDRWDAGRRLRRMCLGRFGPDALRPHDDYGSELLQALAYATMLQHSRPGYEFAGNRASNRSEAHQILRGRGYKVRGTARSACDHDFELVAEGKETIRCWLEGDRLLVSAPMPPKQQHGGKRSRHAQGVILRREDAESFAAWARLQGFVRANDDLAMQVAEGMAGATRTWPAE